MRDLLDRVDALSTRAGAIPGWAGLATAADAIEAAIARAERVRAAIAGEADGPESLAALRRAVSSLIIEANELLAGDGAVAGAATRLEQALAAYDSAADRFREITRSIDEPGFSLLRNRAGVVVAHARRLRDWTNWRRAREEAIGASLGPIVEALESGRVRPSDTSHIFELAYAYWFAFTRIDEEPLLKAFAATEHMDRIQRFREVEDRMGALASRYIRAKICGSIPDKAEVSRRDGYGTLRHQLQLQRPSKPIRQLAAEMGDAFTRLAPCMLMSPLSIAQYLPTDQALFDLVIFDEASQITPWDAIGAMARGKQVVIAGDPRQMPPSNDFQRGPGVAGDGEGEGTERDLDSIIEECLAAGVPQNSLDWHYRSRHESLIAFSNHHYYESRLVTFPAPETRPSAVSWERVPGVWARGSERTNQIEAKAIVDEAVRRLRDPGFVNRSGKPLTLGIITMNIEQMRLVEDLLDRARRAYPEIEPHFADDRLESVVVRNLETAQGDERDVILLGVGFGPTDPGGNTMSMNFGKLNMQGGWRRLNVAVTRARTEMRLFTSFDPGMIDLTRTSQQAVADLKHFVEYADRGPRAIAEADRGSMGGADSPFEEAVTMELRRRGWTVVPQVGVSRFRIDLGIVHPDRPGDYLLGIECDGATYHSAATARDRDKVRAAILEDLGWRLLRVWSTDWWTDKQHAADRLNAAMEQMLEQERTARVETEAAANVTTELAEELNAIFANKPFAATGDGSVLVAERVDAVPSAPAEVDLQHSAGENKLEFTPPSDGLYRLTNFSSFAQSIDAARFYDPDYDSTLSAMIAHVLATEAPIIETQVVQRIARAHGFQRAGRIIRDRVMLLLQQRHHLTAEAESEPFAWLDASSAAKGTPARFPAGEDDIRQIEDICLAELRAAKSSDPVEIARMFGIRRLSSVTRMRIEQALTTVDISATQDEPIT
jgi:very-short-patch-repair endonuclease